MGELDGRVALVTGAAGGIGREVVQRLHDRGARIVVEDISPAVAELETADGRITAVVGDVSRTETAEAAVATAVETYGGLDVLVNNAGVFLGKEILETTDEEWDALMTTNVRGMFVHSRAALPHLFESSCARIVNLGSVSGLVGIPMQGAYCATKGAVTQLTRQMAVAYAPQGVRVNAVAPGAIETSFFMGALPPDPTEALAAIAATHPLGRNGQPDEVADVIVFLAGDGARYMTGSIVSVDGGFVAA
jgi:NAD(P)-dependent dehydrogenase (short-subunit alcohol dehydrogenase family)